jgi:Cdc6-like AAA superfamily ATPase
MDKSKERHLFPGGNTSKGFYSFYRYILSQDDARRIICIKGGPGTGKSQLMKKIAAYFFQKGYTVEHHHCSSDPDSLDGVLIKELNVALLDGTSPHIVDPITPGAVDEILNMGDALNMDFLSSYKKDIININKDIGKCFKRAYRYLGAAKSIHDDWSSLNYESLDSNKISNLLENLKSNIFKNDKVGYGSDRHLFATAITPDGIISYANDLSKDYKKKYILTGGPGFGKTDILKFIGSCGQKKGYFIEYMHDPFIPERLEHIFIPELSVCILTNNEINKASFNGIEYNLVDYTKPNLTPSKNDEIEYDKNLFYDLMNKAISLINKAHVLHDDLETFYIKAMDFNMADNIYDKVIRKIESL